MKIISWNVNGINACIKHGLIEFIKNENADIYCLQEIKTNKENMDPTLFNIPNYIPILFESKHKGHHGTMCYVKQQPINIIYGIKEEEADSDGRVITLEYPNVYVVNAYYPNAGRGLPRLDYKLKFNEIILRFFEDLRKKKGLIIAGDLNVAHTELDIANPKQNIRNAGFTKEERESFTNFLNAGYIDTFRLFVKEGGHYTWWSTRTNAKERNIGWRLDYFVVNKEIESKVKSSEILTEIGEADHCPIRLVVDL